MSSSRAIGFDEAWDIFVSRQSPWAELFRAVAATSHPPGFYTLLHVVSSLGPVQLFDPLLSVLCGVACVLFVGRILNAVGSSRMAEYSGMLLCALAQNHIAISVIVRPYSLANCLMLISFYFVVRLINSDFRSQRDSALFSISLFLAILSHFSAIIYASALAIALTILLVADRELRGKFRAEFQPALPALFRRHAAAPICAVVLLSYLILSAQGGLFVSKSLLSTHDPLQLTPYRYLRAFLFSPAVKLHEFLASVLQAEFNLFSPLPIAMPVAAVLVFAALMGGCGILAWRALRRRGVGAERFGADRSLVFLLPVCCIAVLLLLSVMGKYPFGGELRQQFFIFSFGLLAFVAGADAVPVRRPFRATMWGVLVGLAAVRALLLPLDDSEFGKLVPFKKTDALLAAGKAIYTGTWTAFTLYGHNRDWQLNFENRADRSVRYSLERAGVRARMYVDAEVYFENYIEDDLAARVRALMQREHLSELYVVGFPLGRMRCKVCKKKFAQSRFAELLGGDEFDVSIEREKTRNGEGFALVRRKNPGVSS